MLCSSTSHDQRPPIAARYPGAGSASGAAYLIHPAAAAAANYADGLRHDYALFDAAAGQVDYVQDQCSIHSSNPPGFPHPSIPAPSHLVPSSGKKFWEQSAPASCRASTSVADSAAGQAKSSQHPPRTNGRAFYRSAAATSTAAAKKRKRVATIAQRRAANIRERRRMFNLNEAFDKLRRKVPTFAYEKRLSRIETLRLAITYISFMDGVIRNEGPPSKATLPAPGVQGNVLPSGGDGAIAAPMDADAHHRRQQHDAHFRESSSMTSICW